MVDILGIGAAGLSAYRKLLETVGGNITNATTDGYVRRDVKLSVTGTSNMLPTAAASTSGSGVVVDMVGRASDSFLQIQALKANSLNMHSQTLADSLTQLEKSLFTTSSNPGSVVQDFFNRFNDVANAPTSAAARISVIDAGKQVADMFAQSAATIQDSVKSATAGLDAALTEVNAYTSQLDRLNVQIQSASSSGQKPNDLLDQRDKLLNSLSNLANFSFTELPSGAVTIYLGDTPSGRPLVGPDGAHQLGAVQAGDKIEITMDPFTQPLATNQLTSGTAAGLLEFRAQALSVLGDINRLAVGFSTAVNTQHIQGVDLNGQQGKALFSTDGLTAIPGKTNLGDAKVMLAVTDAAALSATTYSVRYNAANDSWSVKSSLGKTVTGANNLSMDGVSFSFDGRGKDGDTFTVSPLLGAASSMRFLATAPAEVAVALPLYVDPASTNAGNAELTPLKRTSADQVAPQPSADTIFDSANAVNDFIRNGSAFILPAGAASASLTSLGAISAIHFAAKGADISSLAQPDPNDPTSTLTRLTLSLRIDAGLQTQRDLKLDLELHGSNLVDIAAAVNSAADQAGEQDTLFASVTNGALSINALGGNAVSNGAFSGFKTGFSGPSVAATIKGADEGGASAADIQIFTREGRQLSGPPLSDAQARSFVTTANGFLPEAVYIPPSQTSAYPGVSLEKQTSLLQVSPSAAGSIIDVSTQPSFDMPQAGYGQATLSGAVYAMNVDGLKPIRLAGDALSGKDPAGIAAGLAAQMNAQASTYSLTGPAIQPKDLQRDTVAFNVNIDGVDHKVVFHRALDANGVPTSTGTFDLGGSKDLQVSLLPVPDPLSPNFMGVKTTFTPDPAQNSGLGVTTFDVLDSINAPAAVPYSGSVKFDFSALDGVASGDGPQAALGVVIQASVAGKTVRYRISQQDIDSSNYFDQFGAGNASPPAAKLSSTVAAALAKMLNGQYARLPFAASNSDGTLTVVASGSQSFDQFDTPTSPGGALVQTVTGPSTEWTSRVLVTVPATLRTSEPTFAVTALGPATVSDLSALGLGAGQLTTNLTGSGRIEATTLDKLMAPQGITLDLSLAGVDTPVKISAPPGSRSDAVWSGSANGISWSYNNVTGKLTLSSATPGLRVKADTIASRDAAVSLGFMGADLSLKIDNTVTAASDLVSSLLGSSKPTLHVTGDQIGNQVLTIDRPNGDYNGVSWSFVNGKLNLTSGDPTMRIDAGTAPTMGMANALGFSGVEAAGRSIMAVNSLAESLVSAQGVTINVTDTAGSRNVLINSLTGMDQASGLSWSFDGKKIVLSGGNSDLQVNVNSVDTRNAALSLGFLGIGLDQQVNGARLDLESTITDRVGLLVDSSPTVSRVGATVKMTSAVPEDMIVALINQDPSGLRRIAADVQMNTSPPSPPGGDLQIKILGNGHLEIFDPATGQSLANRSWEQDSPVTYRGMSFTIHGDPKTGDIFTIRNDLTRSSDNRNAVQMADLALASIFGKNQGSYQDVYAGVTSKLGSSVQSSNNIAGAAAQAASDLKSAYESKTGVNLDQEAADLIRYQQAYQAAAQVIMAARDMFATILKSF